MKAIVKKNFFDIASGVTYPQGASYEAPNNERTDKLIAEGFIVAETKPIIKKKKAED